MSSLQWGSPVACPAAHPAAHGHLNRLPGIAQVSLLVSALECPKVAHPIGVAGHACQLRAVLEAAAKTRPLNEELSALNLGSDFPDQYMQRNNSGLLLQSGPGQQYS